MFCQGRERRWRQRKLRSGSKICWEIVRVWDCNMLPRNVGESNALQIITKKGIRTNSCNSGFRLALSGARV